MHNILPCPPFCASPGEHLDDECPRHEGALFVIPAVSEEFTPGDTLITASSVRHDAAEIGETLVVLDGGRLQFRPADARALAGVLVALADEIEVGAR